MSKLRSVPGPSDHMEEEDESSAESELSEDEASKDYPKNISLEASDVNLDQVEDEFAAVKKEMSEMSFEDLQKLKEKLGVKVFNSAMYGSKEKRGRTTFKRANKNRPIEISSKRRPRKQKPVIEVKKKVTRDPRFDDLSGQYKEELFSKSYGFLTDIKEREREKLLKKLKKEKNPEKKLELRHLLNRTKQQKLAEDQKQKRTDREKTVRKMERGLVKEGKVPFYLKKSDKIQLELAEKFKDLKKSGKLENYLQKKRKKIASKDKKKLPNKKS